MSLLKEITFLLVVVTMVCGIIAGGLFALKGNMGGIVGFIAGLICIPIYIQKVRGKW